jgi:hypothetical protein
MKLHLYSFLESSLTCVTRLLLSCQDLEAMDPHVTCTASNLPITAANDSTSRHSQRQVCPGKKLVAEQTTMYLSPF